METLPPHWASCAVPVLACPWGTKAFPDVDRKPPVCQPVGSGPVTGHCWKQPGSVYLSFRYLHTLVRHHILPKLFSLGSATWHSHICSPSGKLNPYVFTGLWERGGLSIEFAMNGVVFTVIHDSWLVEKWVGLEKVLWKCSKMHISNLNNFCACKWGIIDCPGSSWIEDNNSVW